MAKSGGNPRTIPEGMQQVNFNIHTDLVNKVDALAYKEGVSKSNVYVRAVERYIEQYEAKNGKLKPRPKGKGLL